MQNRLKRIYRSLHFYLVKLPFVYCMVPLGFLFEFLVTFPFIVLTAIDARRQERARK